MQDYQTLIQYVVLMLILSVFVESFVQAIKLAEPIQPIIDFLKLSSEFLNSLLSCPYCTSFWMAVAVSWIPPALCDFPLSEYIFVVINSFVIHRMSNYVHGLHDRNSFKFNGE